MTDLALAGLDISDPPGRWAALGFAVGEDGRVPAATGTPLTLGIAPPARGIVGWTLGGIEADGVIAGLPTRAAGPAAWIPAARVIQPNGAVAVDHVVVATPDLDALAAALEFAGLGLRRRAEVRGARMGFRRLGGPILEVVEDREAAGTGFWGVTFAVGSREQLDALCAGSRVLGEPRPAVQPGRRIVTVDSDAAGLSTRVAFIDAE